MNLKELQHQIEKLHKEKSLEIASQEGQGRGIPLPLIQGKQKKIADEYDGRIAPLELQKKHLLERRNLSVAIVSAIIGAALGVVGTTFFSALTNAVTKSTPNENYAGMDSQSYIQNEIYDK